MYYLRLILKMIKKYITMYFIIRYFCIASEKVKLRFFSKCYKFYVRTKIEKLSVKRIKNVTVTRKAYHNFKTLHLCINPSDLENP